MDRRKVYERNHSRTLSRTEAHEFLNVISQGIKEGIKKQIKEKSHYCEKPLRIEIWQDFRIIIVVWKQLWLTRYDIIYENTYH